MLRISRQNPEGHKYLVTGVCWYPIDTGLFVSCSSDCTVKVRVRRQDEHPDRCGASCLEVWAASTVKKPEGHEAGTGYLHCSVSVCI